jgi:HAD superfamily hydrolase (TIGR01509 family)
VLPRDRDRTYEIFREVIRGRLRPLPGVLEFTTAARAAGIRLAVATSADPIKLDAILVEIGLPHATFDALVTAEDVTHNKPDPEIFVHAMARLGLPPADCVVVEDTLPGITAALGSGARCLALHTTFPRERIEPLRPRWIAPDLAHLPADFLHECGMA